MALGTNDATAALIGSNGAAFTAPFGTALPTAYDTALNAAFTPVGYLTPAGPSVDSKPTTKDFNVWQEFLPIATRVMSIDGTVKFELVQWNAETLPFAFGGGTLTEIDTDSYGFEPGDPSVIDERSMVVDVHDGDDIVRLVFEKGFNVGGFTTSFTRDNLAVLPIEWKLLASSASSRGISVYSNMASFAESGS